MAFDGVVNPVDVCGLLTPFRFDGTSLTCSFLLAHVNVSLPIILPFLLTGCPGSYVSVLFKSALGPLKRGV